MDYESLWDLELEATSVGLLTTAPVFFSSGWHSVAKPIIPICHFQRMLCRSLARDKPQVGRRLKEIMLQCWMCCAAWKQWFVVVFFLWWNQVNRALSDRRMFRMFYFFFSCKNIMRKLQLHMAKHLSGPSWGFCPGEGCADFEKTAAYRILSLHCYWLCPCLLYCTTLFLSKSWFLWYCMIYIYIYIWSIE